MSCISAHNINKSYGKVTALKDISFDVRQDEIYGIIGPDGAGKTTLFRILATLLLADSGTAVVAGHDVVKDYKQIRREIGYMPGRFSLYQDLSVEENLQFFATVFNTTIQENYHLIEDIYTQIEPFKDRKAGNLSGGMKQKLALCCALIHKPAVLFLDEPTTGVDPVSRKDLWDMLRKLKEHGISILVSTPYMDEASLCDRIALIKDGQFLRIDTPDNIVAAYSGTIWSVRSNNMYGLLKDLRAYDPVKTSHTFGETHHITVDSRLTIDELSKYLQKKEHANVVIKVIVPTIEDCFMLLIHTGSNHE